MRSVLYLLVGLGFVVACSSSGSGGDDSSKSKGDDSSGDDASGGDDTSGCACDVSVNGEDVSIACGASDCIDGFTYACSDSAKVSKGDACTSGSKEDSGTTGGVFDCRGDDCDSATSYCILSYTGKTITSSKCVPFPAACTDCDCASDDAEAAWKKAANNTANCTGATIVCSATNGQVEVSCEKAGL